MTKKWAWGRRPDGRPRNASWHVAAATMLLFVGLVALAPASAHTAAPPPDHMVRLLHDCNDDQFGGDGGGTGYDLHALDLYEAWRDGLGDAVVFKLILNGQGAATIRLDLTADGTARSYSWTTSGSAWSGSFDRVHHQSDIGDGDRFALEGTLALSTLGVAVGAVLDDYTLTAVVGGDEGDHVPGYDGGPLGSCTDNFQRPDYTTKGPVQYASVNIRETEVSVDVGEERFLNVEAENKLKDSVQTVTLTQSGGDGVLVRFHIPSGGSDYSRSHEKELAKRGKPGDSTLIHLAVQGEEAGASGVITVTLTTELGGRVQDQVAYGVGAAAPPTDGADGTDDGDGDGNDIPAVGPVAAAAAVVSAIAWARRRP